MKSIYLLADKCTRIPARFLIPVLLVITIACLPLLSSTPVLAQTESYCTEPSTHVAMPLTDLGNNVYIRMDGQNTGQRGGLYPNGSNTRPAAHEAAGVALARQIIPRAANGQSDPVNGKISMITIGMSNTAAESNAFIDLAVHDPAVNPKLKITNGAMPNMVSSFWVDPNSTAWQNLANQLSQAGISPQQVQVAWIKLAQTNAGSFPDKALALQTDLHTIVQNLKSKYPNVRIAYLSSRTRSYLTWRGLSPEPTAYETGFAVKWLIQDQINGDLGLNYDSARGPVRAPYLSWGPYIWIDGLNPRSDGQVWRPQDLLQDCTHPSSNGSAKVAGMLMNFFKADTTAGWFRIGAPAPTPSPTPSASNLLANPGFELDANNDGRPDAWTNNNSFTRSRTLAYSGSYCGRFSAADNSSSVVLQTINVLPGGSYTFSGRVNIPATTDTFSFRLQVRWRDSSNTVISTSQVHTYTAVTGGWNLASSSLTAPAGAATAQVMLVANSLNASIYVDDFVFRR